MITKALGYLCIVLLISSISFYALWQHADGEIARREAVVAKQQLARAQKVAFERDQLARDLADVRARLPNAGRKVSDAVHNAPSDCSVSAAVGDSLRQSVREGVAARRGAGAVPRSD